MLLRREWLCFGFAAVLGCGGRYHGDPTLDAQPGGGPNGVVAGTATGAASGSEPGSTNGGAVSAGGSAPVGFQPFPIATESGTASPVDAPGWVDYEWSAEASSTAFEICEQGWTLEEAQVNVAELDATLSNSRLIGGDALAACLAPSPDPKSCFERLTHFFPLPDGNTGGVMVRRSFSEIVVYYFRIRPDCSLQRLGHYWEGYDAPSCDDFSMYTLWGIPPISEERRQCRPTNGMYSFDAVVTEDSCGEAPGSFTGVLGFTQEDSESGDLWFPDLAGYTGISQGFHVYIREGQAYGSGTERSSCEFINWTVTLDLASRLTITNDHKVCDDAGERICTWTVESTRITGPL